MSRLRTGCLMTACQIEGCEREGTCSFEMPLFDMEIIVCDVHNQEIDDRVQALGMAYAMSKWTRKEER